MCKRNRSEGWKHAKLTGHSNEESIAKKIKNEIKFKENFEKKLNLNIKIESVNVGGLNEKSVDDVFGGKTKSKTDLTILFHNKKIKNISIKKSLGGQVYLIGVERFLDGFEKQFNKKISNEVKRSIRLFFGNAVDVEKIIDDIKLDDLKNDNQIKIKNYEKRKRRITWNTLEKYDQNLSNSLINWFKENIDNLFLFCFQRGLSNNSSDWADFVWYKNELNENKVDELFDLAELSKKLNSSNCKKDIFPGKTGGGTTIQLPFGFVQWHQSQIQFHHKFNKIQKLKSEMR